jgi:hypothetical protein
VVGGEAEQFDFAGLAAGDAVTLQFASDGSTVSGRVDGDALYLSWADGSGGFTEVRYERASEDEYEAIVARHAEEAVAEITEREANRLRDAPVVEAASALSEAVDDLERSATLPPQAPMADFRARRLRVPGIFSPTAWAIGKDLKKSAKRLTVAAVRKDRSFWSDSIVKLHFDQGFGIDYRIYFCRSDSFSPGGGNAKRFREDIATHRADIGAVRSRAAELESAIATNPDASPPFVSPAEARRLADQHQVRVDAAVGDWRRTVAMAVDLRKGVRKAFLSARRKYKQAGISVPGCKQKVWGPGI